jgi:hypothetical protein
MNRVKKYFALLAIANFFSAASMAIVSIDYNIDPHYFLPR